MTYILHSDLCIFIIIPHSFLLRMRNISDKTCRENQNTFYIQLLFRNSCHLWDKEEKYIAFRQATDDNVIWRMCFTCWMTMVTDTLIIYHTYCFSTSTMLSESASMLHYTNMACFVRITNAKSRARIRTLQLTTCVHLFTLFSKRVLSWITLPFNAA